MGTWALPKTAQKAKELQELLANPLPAKNAKEKLYDLFGDDDLFDHILRVEKKYGKDYDVRGIVEVCLQDIIIYNGVAYDWDKETLKIYEEIFGIPLIRAKETM